MPPRARVVLAEDCNDVADAIRGLLEPDFHVLRAVGDGEALVEAARELRPDAVISDLAMPRMDGIEACRQILGAGLCDSAILLTMHNALHLVTEAMGAGIRGYVLKVDAGEELIPALDTVIGGRQYLSRSLRTDRES